MLILLLTVGTLAAQDFSQYFTDKTLRVDYFFTGNAERQEIWVDELSVLPGWSGRKHNLAQLPLTGYGQITVRDLEKGPSSTARLSLLSFRNGWRQTKPARYKKASKTRFYCPIPSNRSKWK